MFRIGGNTFYDKKKSDINSRVQKIKNRINCGIPWNSERISQPRSGSQPAKLDQNSFSGIFLGYTATDNNILYLDLEPGVVKQSHHTQFNEAWYLQSSCPLAAQLLYDLGVEPDEVYHSATGPLSAPPEMDFCLLGTIKQIVVPWPPLAPRNKHKTWRVLAASTTLPLSL